MKLTTKVLIFLIVLSLVSFIYFRDRYEEPKQVTLPDDSTGFGCDMDDGFRLIVDPKDPTQYKCFKEAGFGHIKYTFFMALSMALWTGVGLVFYIEYKKKDETSVIQFLQDTYQKENKPIPKCPDTFKEKGFIWTFQGYDKVISSTEPILFVGQKDMVKEVGRNIIFWGKREKITPLELYHYIKKDANLFKRITGASIEGYISGKFVRKEEIVPEIYFPRPLSYEVLKSFYTIKGNYAFGANRFSAVIRMMFKMKRSIELLDKTMDTTFKSMMLKGEQYVAATARTGKEADSTRRTDTAGAAYQNGYHQYDEPRRREM